MKILRWTLRILSLLFLLALIYFFFFAASITDQQKNRVYLEALPAISDAAAQLHPQLRIADWHSDNLLWKRDPLERLAHNHVDIPKLLDGNFTLQVFDAVIKVPSGVNYDSNSSSSDMITYLAMANRWPFRTWTSLCERALYQSEILHKAEEESNGALKIIKSKEDLTELLDSKNRNEKIVGGLLSIEGLHALEGDLKNLDKLYAAGYRMMGLTHFFDNEVGGSSAGLEKGGLTDFGKEVIQKMNELGIIIDLAHASSALIQDVLALSNQPIVVSHTGVKGTYSSPRNLSDEEIISIAEKGGIVGIGFWEGAVGGIEPSYIIKAMKHVIDLVGIEHVALGSDFDGSTYVYFNAGQIIVLTDALIQAGFSNEAIQQIMGRNQIEFLERHLPE